MGELKTIKKIEDYDTFLNIYRTQHKYYYFGNKPITDEKRKELEEKDNKKSFRRYAIYMLEDGYYFMFDTMPCIESTLYYPDDFDDPGTSLEYFLHYNLKYFNYDLSTWEREKHDLATIGCCCGSIELHPFINLSYSNGGKEVYYRFFTRCGASDRNEFTIRDLTEDEIDDILTITKQLKEEYKERLIKYYNKYKNKIHTYGYWRDR